MAGLTAASSIADALKSQAVAGVVESLFVNNEVMGEFPMIEFTGGSTINIKHHYAGNTSVGTYSEGDAIGAPGSQSYVTAQWPEQHYKCVIQITGHARDYLRDGSNEAAFYNQIAQEFDRAMNDLVDKVSTDMLGTGTTAPIGLQGIVDSTGTLATLSKSAYTWFASYEGSNGTTVSVQDLQLAMYSGADADYAGRVTEIWCSWKQQYKLQAVIGVAGTTASPVRVNAPPSGNQGLNIGDVRDIIMMGGFPIKPKRDLTNSIFLGLQKDDFFIGRMRDWKVVQLGVTDDSEKFLVTGSFGLGCKNPKHSWKMTGYTA